MEHGEFDNAKRSKANVVDEQSPISPLAALHRDQPIPSAERDSDATNKRPVHVQPQLDFHHDDQGFKVPHFTTKAKDVPMNDAMQEDADQSMTL